jgi:hypothetical protein
MSSARRPNCWCATTSRRPSRSSWTCNFIAPDYAAVANVNAGVDHQRRHADGGVRHGGGEPAHRCADAVHELRRQQLEGAGIRVGHDPASGARDLVHGDVAGRAVLPDGHAVRAARSWATRSSCRCPRCRSARRSGEGNLLVLVHAPSIAMADEGGLTIDASEEAAIQMLDNPTNASTGGTTATTMVSMFQTNSVALRATRFINWKLRRSHRRAVHQGRGLRRVIVGNMKGRTYGAPFFIGGTHARAHRTGRQTYYDRSDQGRRRSTWMTGRSLLLLLDRIDPLDGPAPNTYATRDMTAQRGKRVNNTQSRVKCRFSASRSGEQGGCAGHEFRQHERRLRWRLVRCRPGAFAGAFQSGVTVDAPA